MSKKTKQIELSMDMIMKMQPEVFRDTVKAQPLGFNKNLLNLLSLQYQQCVSLKTGLTAVLEKGEVPNKDIEEYNKAISDCFMCMQLIEDRYTILNLIIKEVESKVNDTISH